MNRMEALLELGRLIRAWLRGEGPLFGLLGAYFSLLAGEKC